ncbi:hypothetical protein [uncultured Xanthomonas sp.]|uniref:hypothetical protein n=1 Tax=uncultured Xanthomonas sp. TaxID=152831 RepID=UPI0025EC324A|nr:hypothetical protein [uncultured Xanthomonas sp.]
MVNKITIKAKSEQGRWRAGMHFTRAGVTLAVSDLSEGQIAAIAADPELHVAPAADAKDERGTREAAEKAAAEKAAAEKKVGK